MRGSSSTSDGPCSGQANFSENVNSVPGVGFAPAASARLFEKFSARHKGAGNSGTGLGLFIVRKLMQLAGGSVSAHSDGPGKGATFVLRWPSVAGAAP